MKKLEKLIQELCPNGVPFKKVKDVYNRLKGTPITAGKMKEIACEDGEIRVFAGGKTVIDAHEKDIPKANITRTPAVLVQSRGVIDVVYYDKPFTFKNEMWAYTADNNVSVKYLYYVLKNNIQSFRDAASGMGSLPQISLPVTAELTAELIARKKQYEFYRDKLLTAKTEIKTVELGEICTFVRGPFGGALKKEIFKPQGYAVYEQQHAIYRTLDFRYFIDGKKFEELKRFSVKPGDMIVSCSGTIGKTFVIPEDAPEGVINQALLKLTPHEKLNVFYLQYFFENTISKELNGVARGGAIKNVPSVSELKAIKIPVPPLDMQERLVQVLDNFESICTNLNIGLPAEIEARQKQYEYYRDLLLTFAETGSTLVTDRQTDRQTELNAIRLIQYVFGYVTLPMGSLFDFRNGLSKGKDFFGTGIPFIRYTDVYNNRFLKEKDITALVECTPIEIKKLKVHRGDVFFTRTSETAEDVGWSSVMLDDIGDCVFNGFTIKATPKTDFLLPEYCAFCFDTDDFRQYVTSHCAFTTRASLTGKTIAGYKLTFPSIEKQREIVNVLSKFHTLCNDLSKGLPAEIEARRKQYEYYRDKLLSFEELQKK